MKWHDFFGICQVDGEIRLIVRFLKGGYSWEIPKLEMGVDSEKPYR